MGTPQFSVPILEWLVGSHLVVAVYTRPDQGAGRGREQTASPVKIAALRLGLAVIQPPTLREPQAVEQLRGLAPEVIVVAAYGLILPAEVLALPSYGCLNVHPSLLPRHRGPSPIVYTILSGDEVGGVSLMLMDPGLDTGPVLAQVSLPLSPHETTESLTRKLSLLAAELLAAQLPLWLRGAEHRPRPQDNRGATYSRLIRKEDGELDWRLPAVELDRRVRAYYPWPGAFTRFQGRVLKVLEAQPRLGEGGGVGQVTAVGTGVGVVTGEGVLRLLRVQLEGKRPLPVEQFLLGQRDFLGAKLG